MQSVHSRLRNENILVFASDDGGRRGYRSSFLEAVARSLPAAAASSEATERVQVEHTDERVAELFAHRAVEDEVDSVVDERQDVEQVAECHVDLVDEARRQQTAEQVDDALRQFRHQEQDNYEEQHHRRTVRLAISAAAGCVLASGRALAAQVLTTFLRLSHGLNEQKAQHRQTNARHQTHEQRL